MAPPPQPVDTAAADPADMRVGSGWMRPIRLLRGVIRASELWLAVIAAAVGAVSGLAAVGVSAAARALQMALYGIAADERLSAIPALTLQRLPFLPLGGLILGILTWAWTRVNPRPVVDPVEANALRGGRMSIGDSLFVGAQSLISNGFGASVGLEAAYAQLGGVVASAAGGALNLRRSDLRAFVGAGAGAGIAAAFGAPLTGAFYAFEIIIGSYTAANIAPVVAAALAGALVSRSLHSDTLVFHAHVSDTLSLSHYLLFALLGVVCAVAGVGIMRLVALMEAVVARILIPRWLRPALGGAILAGLAWWVPETLSAGHGAMRSAFDAELALGVLAGLLLAKTAASVVALGFGFRGGLFFASLYLGSLLGRICVVGLYSLGVAVGIDPLVGALIGMGALAVAIIGGPFTMSFLVLETTGDFALATGALTAAIVASLVVRETFGYSFSTWRLHLRGETIRSAHDVGWLRNLTAGRMMRPSGAEVPAVMSVSAFCERFPLGSARRVVALGPEGCYAGLLPVSAIHASRDPAAPVARLAILREVTLTPDMSIKAVMSAFDAAQGDELAVVDKDGHVLGLLSEAVATRRYADALEAARLDLTGGD